MNNKTAGLIRIIWIFHSCYNSCTGVSLRSHRLSSLKVGVRNEFLTPTYSHRLRSLLLLLWTKWFFRPACLKRLGSALYSELLIFVSLNKVFRNFVLEGRKRVCVCFVRARNRIRCYLKLRAVKFCFAKSYEVVYSPSLVKRERAGHFFYLLRCS